MRTLLVISMILFVVNVSAQKINLNLLPEKERKEYLLKTAYEVVMKHAPEWHRNYKTPEIESYVISIGPDKGRIEYSVKWYYDPQKEDLEYGFSVSVVFWADTGEVRGLTFGDEILYFFPPKTSTQGQSQTQSGSPEKPFYRPYPYKNE